ncbi:unnamed protein product [Rotaria sp. Silwood2]|nr:unnamed protein product [Rotaria sp. Silwood2]CAF4257302.1 unnamed protein product [Rotaria sp. Silwood2]
MMTQEKEYLEMSDEFDENKMNIKLYDYPDINFSSSSMSTTMLIKYDCDDIVDPELICPICHLPFTDPHVAKCGHTFCIGCITFWDEDYCPSPSCEDNWTKVDIKPITAKFVHNMLNRIQVNCKACGQKMATTRSI